MIKIIGYFNTNGVASCSPCHNSCKTCSGPAIYMCLGCDTVINFRFIVNSNSCVCLDRYYEVTNQTICQACHYSCLTCSGPNNNQCLSCNTTANRSSTPVNGSCICKNCMEKKIHL